MALAGHVPPVAVPIEKVRLQSRIQSVGLYQRLQQALLAYQHLLSTNTIDHDRWNAACKALLQDFASWSRSALQPYSSGLTETASTAGRHWILALRSFELEKHASPLFAWSTIARTGKGSDDNVRGLWKWMMVAGGDVALQPGYPPYNEAGQSFMHTILTSEVVFKMVIGEGPATFRTMRCDQFPPAASSAASASASASHQCTKMVISGGAFTPPTKWTGAAAGSGFQSMLSIASYCATPLMWDVLTDPKRPYVRQLLGDEFELWSEDVHHDGSRRHNICLHGFPTHLVPGVLENGVSCVLNPLIINPIAVICCSGHPDADKRGVWLAKHLPGFRINEKIPFGRNMEFSMRFDHVTPLMDAVATYDKNLGQVPIFGYRTKTIAALLNRTDLNVRSGVIARKMWCLEKEGRVITPARFLHKMTGKDFRHKEPVLWQELVNWTQLPAYPRKAAESVRKSLGKRCVKAHQRCSCIAKGVAQQILPGVLIDLVLDYSGLLKHGAIVIPAVPFKPICAPANTPTIGTNEQSQSHSITSALEMVRSAALAGQDVAAVWDAVNLDGGDAHVSVGGKRKFVDVGISVDGDRGDDDGAKAVELVPMEQQQQDHGGADTDEKTMAMAKQNEDEVANGDGDRKNAKRQRHD